MRGFVLAVELVECCSVNSVVTSLGDFRADLLAATMRLGLLSS